MTPVAREARLRVVVANALAPQLCQRIGDVDPRVDVAVEHELLAPMRFPGDHSGDPEFRRDDAQEARFTELLESADVLYGIPDTSPARLAAVVRANPRLRWVHTMAAGGGSQVLAAGLTPDQLARVQFTTSAGVHGLPLAEWAIFGIFAGAKELPRLYAGQLAHAWPERVVSRPVAGSTVLVLGLGGIGLQVARLAGALGMRVLGVKRTPEAVEGVEVHPTSALADVIGEADHVVVTLPGTRHTEGLLDAQLLARAKRGVTVVNVGRGTVVDEPALVDALKTGQVGFAALDVFAVEPLPHDSPLWDLPNVLISPHTAALDVREEERIAELFCQNLRAFLDGAPMVNIVDADQGY